MRESQKHNVWIYRACFVLIALALLFFRLLPLGSVAGNWPGPDLLLCLMLAWVTQRPDHLPTILIALVVLAEDMILMRPPGLWTVLVVLATEFLRARAALTRDLGFVAEWLLISLVMIAMLLAYRTVFAVAFMTQPGFGFAFAQTVGSILMYPVVVWLLRVVIHLRKPLAGEVDAKGRRI
ncbi:rod shape-determining protein MreD [Pseudorhodobacter turbinis]|uniref:Rod shape-determining protein MreD n=1 Tax=Pseudorhodobacter turbinis TaxID=2500533 RepID=A0A4P8EDS8_9RHOB|nr:rod shape-determining protein MreD [Pseudorhodobacter turbinis]QCO55150.1 rod shape-determining protein MreD [Pseudorhodobacter turbinis]